MHICFNKFFDWNILLKDEHSISYIDCNLIINKGYSSYFDKQHLWTRSSEKAELTLTLNFKWPWSSMSNYWMFYLIVIILISMYEFDLNLDKKTWYQTIILKNSDVIMTLNWHSLTWSNLRNSLCVACFNFVICIRIDFILRHNILNVRAFMYISLKLTLTHVWHWP
jgi:hypothetical protein